MFHDVSLKVVWIEARISLNSLCQNDGKNKMSLTDFFATSETLTAKQANLLGKGTTRQRRDRQEYLVKVAGIARKENRVPAQPSTERTA